MLFVGNGEELTQEIQHRKVIRITMKVQLKKDVKVSDIPRASGEHKRLIGLFSRNKQIEVDSLPKGMDAFVEEVSMKVKEKKGDK